MLEVKEGARTPHVTPFIEKAFMTHLPYFNVRE